MLPDFGLLHWLTVSSKIPTVSPMDPTRVREPFHRPGWVYERKEDGWRMPSIG